MGSVGPVDNRTFEDNFTVDGVLKLRERLKEKLKELIGEYTDDHLVDYIIMLLRNGRNKEEARNGLNVILRDNCDSFVCWLWDHLTLNIDLYVQPKELPLRTVSEVEAGGHDNKHLNSESHKLSRSRRNKGWKALVRREAEPPTLWSYEVFERSQTKVGNGPRSPVRRKRGRRDTRKQVTTNAPRRLLQFAVRDAVAASRPSILSPPVDPSLKRLRYVV